MKFRITVPATSANIGPGFDAMGLALSLYNRFEINQADRTKVLGCEEQFAGPDNLFLQAFRHAAGLLGIGVPEIELTVDAEIPLARGLGSSAAMIVGGVAAAFVAAGMGGEGFDEDEKRRIFEIAAALEGHPDNAAPAVFGGFCSSILKNEDSPRAFYARCSVDPNWRFHALIPPFELSTRKARAALPDSIPRRDAVFNLGRAALLALAFQTRRLDLVTAACEDKIHQPYRAPLIAGYEEITRMCEKTGARAVWLSGAGPTIMALSSGGAGTKELFAVLNRELESRPEGAWRQLALRADDTGLKVEVS
ncbi:MAG TPA: homoserine kinase [Spirochaetaceae bacterium]|jgi:homoserine kinase|nr:homoserine kinase [Spirochaetaceae bacterium]